MLAPAGTPKAIVHQIAAEVGRIVKEQKFADRLINLGIEPVGNSPDELAAMIAADVALWGDAVKIAGIGRDS